MAVFLDGGKNDRKGGQTIWTSDRQSSVALSEFMFVPRGMTNYFYANSADRWKVILALRFWSNKEGLEPLKT